MLDYHCIDLLFIIKNRYRYKYLLCIIIGSYSFERVEVFIILIHPVTLMNIQVLDGFLNVKMRRQSNIEECLSSLAEDKGLSVFES